MSEVKHDQRFVSLVIFKMHNVLSSGFGSLRLLDCPKKATLNQVYFTFQPLGSVRCVPGKSLSFFEKLKFLVVENQ